MHSRSTEVRHRIYVRDATSAALIETEQSIELSPGDVIDIAGFPVVSATNPTLKNAIIRRVGHVAPPAASALARETPLAATHDSELVTVNAVLLTEIATAAGRSLVLKIGDTVFEALARSALEGGRDRLWQRRGRVDHRHLCVRARSAAGLSRAPSLGRRCGAPLGAAMVDAPALAGARALRGAHRPGWPGVEQEERQPGRARQGAVPRHPRRAQPPRQRTARYARTGPGRHSAAARRGRQDARQLAGKGPARAGHRLADAALQPERSSPIGDGSPSRARWKRAISRARCRMSRSR